MRTSIAILIVSIGVSVHAQSFTNWPGADARFGIGLNSQTHKLIEAVDVSIPVTSDLGISLVGSRIGDHVSYGGGALTIGTTWKVPLIGPIGLFTGDGVVYDGGHNIANYGFAGAERIWNLGNGFRIGSGFTTANISTQPGVDIMIGASISWRPNRW